MDDRSFVAAQDFLLASKSFWTTRLYPAVKDTYETKAAKLGGPVETPAEVGALLENETLYRYFSWLERHLQRFKYAGRYGLVPYHDERRAALLQTLEGAGAELSADLKMPSYYKRVDIHQHPGGVWSDDLALAKAQIRFAPLTPRRGSRRSICRHPASIMVPSRSRQTRFAFVR